MDGWGGAGCMDEKVGGWMAWHGMARHGTARHGTARHGGVMGWHGMEG